MRWRPLVLGAAIWLASAGCRKAPAPDEVYQTVRLQVRQGNLKDALAQAERAWQEWRSHPESKHHWQFRILKSEVLLAQGRPKEALPLLEPAPPPNLKELAARRLLYQGYARSLLAEYTPAGELLDRAYKLALECASPGLSAEVELRRGSNLARLRQPAPAEQAFLHARELAASARDEYLQTAALGNLGFNLLSTTRFDEAIPLFEQVLALSEKAGTKPFIAGTLGNLGRCYYGLGDYERAIRLFERAELLARESGDLLRRELWLGSLGQANLRYYRGQEPRKVIPYFEQALALARQLGDAFSTGEWLDSLTLLWLSAGDLAAAEACNREVFEICRQRSDLRVTRVYAVYRSAQIAQARKQFVAAERRFREVLAAAPSDQASLRFLTRINLGSLYSDIGDWHRADAEFQAGLREIERTRTALSRDEWKLTIQHSANSSYGDYVEFLLKRGQVDRALEVAESFRSRLLAEKLGLERSAGNPVPASRFREIARAHRAVLVSFWLGVRQSYAWIVMPDRIALVGLPPEREFRSAIDAYNGAIENLQDPLETRNPAGRKLSEMLLAPLAKFVPPGSRVILVPAGWLYQLNLESLPAPSGRPHYWLEDVTLAVVPSLTILPTSTQLDAGRPNSLLLIGRAVPPVPDYPALPGVDEEVAGVCSSLSGVEQAVYTGASAHPGAYREADPGRFRLIHFAAHATANRDSPLDSAVILSRRGETYKLYAREVIRLPLQARLVTISACRSAGARVYFGEGLVGFAWAFLEAGARNVIAGLWDVNDRSTAMLMQQLYAGIAAGRSPAAALRAAKLSLAQSPGPYRKPYYWAPFQLYARWPSF